jgi:uncharacterized membrane protein
MVNKKYIHIALIVVLLAGTIFAWYNSAKELCAAGGTCTATSSAMLGLPICVWGAIFFTIALVLAVAMWFIKE